MGTNKPLLIFDCDGVLVDSEILHSEVEASIGRELLGIDRDAISHNRMFSGGGLKNVYISWVKETGKSLPPGLDAEMTRRKAAAFRTDLQAIPFIKDALAACAMYPRCVASGTPLPTLKIALQTTGLIDSFAPHLFSADMVAHGKPAPDLFLYAAEQMGFVPSDCLVIEDSVYGVNAALAAGMRVIGFTGGSHCMPDHAGKLQAATRIISDMRALPQMINNILSVRLPSFTIGSATNP